MADISDTKARAQQIRLVSRGIIFAPEDYRSIKPVKLSNKDQEWLRNKLKTKSW